MSPTVPGAFDLTGQVALVTGSSSDLGIGFASARLLGQLGASVMVTGTTDRAVIRADELQREGIAARSHTADLMDPRERSGCGRGTAFVTWARAPWHRR